MVREGREGTVSARAARIPAAAAAAHAHCLGKAVLLLETSKQCGGGGGGGERNCRGSDDDDGRGRRNVLEARRITRINFHEFLPTARLDAEIPGMPDLYLWQSLQVYILLRSLDSSSYSAQIYLESRVTERISLTARHA